MQTSSPPSPVLAEKTPAWKRWLDGVVEGKMCLAWGNYGPVHQRAPTRRVGDGATISFCGCCGAIPVSPDGTVGGYGDITNVRRPGYPGTSQNRYGIYFGEAQSAATLVERAALEEAITYEIEDGGVTHSFAWKDF